MIIPRRLLLVFLPSLILLPACGPPDGVQRGEMREGRGSVYGMRAGGLLVETAILPSDSSDLSRIILHVRVKPDLLVFVRTESADPDSAYRGGMDFSVEFLDPRGVPAQFRRKITTLHVSESVKTSEAVGDQIVRLEALVPPGRYTARCIFTVLESQIERRFDVPLLVRKPLDYWPLAYSAIAISRISPREAIARGYGGGAPYRWKSRFLLSYYGAEDAVLEAALVPRRTFPAGSLESPRPAGRGAPIRPDTVYTGMILEPESSNPLAYRLMQSPEKNNRILLFSLPTDTLQFGSYRLRILLTAGGRTDTLSQDCPIVWEDEPASLRRIEYAVSAMRYILTDEKREEMGSGEPAEIWEKFFAYWKQRDPTPGTVWNERMVEYFRRVDEASEAYRSVREPDGVFTARGRMHILLGTPERVERTLRVEGAPVETWYYPSLGKRFVFIDRGRNGSYELLDEGTL